jgi:diguanylate cyclase (GGDEF)-like protein
MLELRTWYRERLSTRIAALEKARAELKRPSPESIESIRRIAHSLRGSGATYGFPEITEVARGLEEAEEEQLTSWLDRLLATLRQAAAQGRVGRAGILIIEDDEEQSRFYEDSLAAPGRDFYVARTAAQAQSFLEEKEISLILLDLVLPDTDGRNLLLKLRDRLATAAIPVVVITVKNASQVRDECLALGADDFLEKPVTRESLEGTVSARLRSGSDMARELRRDPLTGLPNRASFHEFFHRARCAAMTAREPLTVGLLDMDTFKQVNDLFGHAMGDQVLRRVAAILSRTLRGTDFLARWGGEEFVAVFPKTDAAGAVKAFQKALAAVRGEPFSLPDGRTLQVTFSAGVAQVSEDMGAEEAVNEADRYLYLAKEAGRNRVLCPNDTLEVPRRSVLLVEDDELIRLVVHRLLEREGYQVTTAGDGSAALAAALETSYQMVVTDVQMPRMNGLELLQRLRQVPGYARVPVVVMTSTGNEEDVARGYELGADDYIVKPFSSAEFVSRVRRLLKSKR